MTAKYWESEEPQRVETNKNFLAYFPKAGKMQVARKWHKGEGEVLPAKVTTLDREDIANHPEARALLEEFLRSAS